MKERRDDTRVRFSTALAYRRLADVLRLLEQHEEALENYDRALALLRQLETEAPGNPEYRRQAAHCRNFQGEVYRVAGRLRDAKAAYEEASRIEGGLAREFPGELDDRQKLARTLNNLGIVLRQTGELAEAERQLRRSADLLEDLTRQQRDVLGHRQLLGRAYLNLGTVIRTPARFSDAKEAYERAISMLRPLTESHPEKPDFRHELAVALNNTGNLLSSTERFEDAQKIHSLAKGHFAALSADFPNTPIYRQELANTHNSIGNVAFHLKDHQSAIHDWNQAAKLLEGLLAKQATMATYQGDLGMVLGNLGLAHHALGHKAEARAHLEKSVERLEKVVASGGKQVSFREALQDSYQNLAEVLVVSGDHAAAATAARKLSARSQSAIHHYYSACFLARCVPLAENDQKLSAAERDELASKYADQAVAALAEAIDKGFDDVKRMRADRDTIFKSIASRPDYQRLLQRFGDKLFSASR
jgi:tetratricopeptide (TPR) repeat protein